MVSKKSSVEILRKVGQVLEGVGQGLPAGVGPVASYECGESVFSMHAQKYNPSGLQDKNSVLLAVTTAPSHE